MRPLSRQDGTSPDIRHGAASPDIRHGAASPDFRRGAASPDLRHGAATLSLRHGAASPDIRHGAASPDFRRGGGTLLLSGITCIALLVGLPLPAAQAFVQTMSCSLEEGAQVPCIGNEEPMPVHWDRGCVPYHVNRDGARLDGHDMQDTIDAIDASFNAWNDAECSYLHLYRAGDTSEDRVGYNSCRGAEGNANVVIFRDEEWPWALAAVALTSVTYRVSTGQILDADIELNLAEFPFGLIEDPARERTVVDLPNALTHEVGHLVGLDHTTPDSMQAGPAEEWVETVMYERTTAGEIRKRTLHPNDELAICSIYPVDLDPHGEDCAEEPRFYYLRPDAPMDQTCRARRGCSATPATPSPLPKKGALLVFGGLLLLRGRWRSDGTA